MWVEQERKLVNRTSETLLKFKITMERSEIASDTLL